MTSKLPKFAAPLMCILASMLLLVACGGGESKEDIIEQTWDCWAKYGDPEVFEQSMLMMFPTAEDMDDAKKQFIYVSSAAPIEDLKVSRDDACGASASVPAATPRDTEESRPTATSRPTPETASTATPQPTETETNDDARTGAPGRSPSFESVSAGDEHTCGVRTGGSIACWGYNQYRLANWPAGSFVSVSAGGSYTCGVRTNGSIACWSGWGSTLP